MLLAAPAVWGQLEINSSPNIVGSGARALGMGGAFIAIADDATAASWNPGGLTQLERPEISLVYNFKWFEEDFNSKWHRELDGANSVAWEELNYFSVVYPIRRTFAGRNFVVSLNYQRQYDFDRDLNLRYRSLGTAGGVISQLNSRIDYSQRGALGSISPALGFEITNRLSMGVAVNLWSHGLLPDNEWKVRQENRLVSFINGRVLPISFGKQVLEKDYKNFDGTNVTVGVLYRATERLKLGAVYHSKFTADVDYSEYSRIQIPFVTAGFGRRQERKLEYVFPAAFGLGAAYRFPNDKLTVSLDVTRREWDQFEIYDPRNGRLSLRRRSGVTGLPKYRSPHDPTYTVRLGAEYVFVNDKKPVQHYLPSLRAGLFYDPEPAGGRKDRWFGLGKVTGEPDDYYGFSLGAGVLIRNRVNLDVAYVYRWGDDVRKDSLAVWGTDADVDQHTLYVSTVIYF